MPLRKESRAGGQSSPKQAEAASRDPLLSIYCKARMGGGCAPQQAQFPECETRNGQFGMVRETRGRTYHWKHVSLPFYNYKLGEGWEEAEMAKETTQEYIRRILGHVEGHDALSV